MRRRDRSRRPAHRREKLEPRDRVLAVCEGKNTEPQYLEGLRRYCRNSLIRVKIVPGAGVPLTLVRRAKELKRDADHEAKRYGDSFLAYNQVWCVFDQDEHPNILEALDLARRSEIQIALSNPCFELWLMLHFQERPGQLSRHEARRAMRRHITNYDKKIDFSDYAKRYPDAVRRAAAIYRECVRADEVGRNPSTSVHLLTKLVSRYSEVYANLV